MTVEELPGFRHHAVFVDSESELCRLTAASALEGLAASERVMIEADDERRESISSLLGDAAGDVVFHHSPGRDSSPTVALSGFREMVSERLPPEARIRSIGQVHPGWARPYRWVRYEAYANEIFADLPMTGVCFYDLRFISDRIRRAIEETHHRLGPTLTSSRPSRYREPRKVAAGLPTRRLHPRRAPDSFLAEGSSLRSVRQTVADLAPHHRAEEAALVVHELAALSMASGGSPSVKLWAFPRRLVVQVLDQASDVFLDPFAGLRPPDAGGQVALWVAGHLADDLVVERTDGGSRATVVFQRRR